MITLKVSEEKNIAGLYKITPLAGQKMDDGTNIDPNLFVQCEFGFRDDLIPGDLLICLGLKLEQSKAGTGKQYYTPVSIIKKTK